MPFYRFMTGASRFRLEAETLEEALRVAFEDLQPDEATKAVIRATIYEEEAGRKFESGGDADR